MAFQWTRYGADATLRGGKLMARAVRNDPHGNVTTLMKKTLLECVRSAGQILLEFCGKDANVRHKGDQSNVVTDADLASERWIVDHIRARFPRHSILAEETGYARQPSEFTWVIDPLDGTSNFAAGLPWFGVQIAVLQNATPILAAMYLPETETLYFAEKGCGTYRDKRRVRVTAEIRLKNVLCAFGLDATASKPQARQQAAILVQVTSGVRNVRATNCLLDFCYTIDGRLGGCINFNTKIWDIAPLCLMLPEAGGHLTDLSGDQIKFRLDAEPFDRNYTMLGASRKLHPRLFSLVKQGSHA